MSLNPNLPAAILDTILPRLALPFLSGAADNTDAARHAAIRMLTEHQPETEDELRLAAQIVGFGFHALAALGQSTASDMPLNRVLRLRGSAVSLSRESHKAQRRLDFIQDARRTQPDAAPQPAPPEPSPRIDNAIALIEETGKVQAVAKATGLTWSQAFRQRARDKRLAEKQKKQIAAAATVPTVAHPTPIHKPDPAAPDPRR
jgi:hypothetical protein